MRILFIVCLSFINSTAFAEGSFNLLEDDCFNEWKHRGWVIGEDNTPATQVPTFVEGIKRICKVRADMFADNPDISPYIQGRLAEIAPYVFGADEASIESLVLKLEERRPGPQFSGTYMRD